MFAALSQRYQNVINYLNCFIALAPVTYLQQSNVKPQHRLLKDLKVNNPNIETRSQIIIITNKVN